MYVRSTGRMHAGSVRQQQPSHYITRIHWEKLFPFFCGCWLQWKGKEAKTNIVKKQHLSFVCLSSFLSLFQMIHCVSYWKVGTVVLSSQLHCQMPCVYTQTLIFPPLSVMQPGKLGWFLFFFFAHYCSCSILDIVFFFWKIGNGCMTDILTSYICWHIQWRTPYLCHIRWLPTRTVWDCSLSSF